MRRHMSRVVLWRKQRMFTLSRVSRTQFRLNKSSEEPEHATLAEIAPLMVKVWMKRLCPITQKKADIEVLDAALSRTSGDPAVCKRLSSFQF